MHAIYTLMMKFVDLQLPRDCRLTIDQLIDAYKQHHMLRPSCAIFVGVVSEKSTSVIALHRLKAPSRLPAAGMRQ